MEVSQRRVTMLMINTLPCSPSLSHRAMPSVPQHIPSLNQRAPDGKGRAGAMLSVPLSEYSSYTPFPKDPYHTTDCSRCCRLDPERWKRRGRLSGPWDYCVQVCAIRDWFFSPLLLLFPVSRHCRVMVIILPPPHQGQISFITFTWYFYKYF